MGTLRAYSFAPVSFAAVQCIFLLLTRPLLVLFPVFELVNFMEFKLGFSWACGAMPDMSSGFRHIFGCIYIYMCVVMQLILVLQVAVVWFCVCLVSLFCFRFWIKMN